MKFKRVAVLAVALSISGVAWAEEENFAHALFTPLRQKEIVPVDNKQYKEECGSCHFAYPPGLLPSKSWEKLLTADALSKHFGENAELDSDTLKVIHDYIKRKHREIPEKMIKGNKDVKSLSYCDACHTQANKGVFDADTVRIPNYPDWED
jgi:hypothetical protein